MRNLLSAAVAAIGLATVQAFGAGNPDIFVGDTPITLTLEAPLAELFEQGRTDADHEVEGQLTWSVGGSAAATLAKVVISERGHTSRQASECAFPKLKIDLTHADVANTPFAGMRAIKLGTHCDERQDEALTAKYGRLANERAPSREALVYRLLETAGVPTLLARPARVTYVFTDDRSRSPLTRMALLLEDDQQAQDRLGATGQITETTFGSARELFEPRDTARLAFAQAMIGNFDWCLRMFGGDIYRCDERHPLWNILAFERPGRRALPLVYDFDLSGIVVGRHIWFDQVFSADFADVPSAVRVEVQAQVQRTRSLFDRPLLDDTRRHFVQVRAALLREIDASTADERGKALATEYLAAFFDAIESDARFYGPVVVDGGHVASLDPEGARPACGDRSTVPVGTPVSAPLEVRGDQTRVRLLDALWEWTGNNRCDAVHRQAVWLPSVAIGNEYPR